MRRSSMSQLSAAIRHGIIQMIAIWNHPVRLVKKLCSLSSFPSRYSPLGNASEPMALGVTPYAHVLIRTLHVSAPLHPN